MRFCFKAISAIFSSASTLIFSRRICKQPMENLKKVFVRLVEDEEDMKLTFIYSNQITPDKMFSFLRSKDEQLNGALRRIQSKIETARLKAQIRMKKRNKGKLNETSNDACKAQDLIITLTRGGEVLDGETPNKLAWIEGSQLNIDETSYDVVTNPPSVELSNFPRVIMAGFPIYPKLDLEFCSRTECKFTWYRSLAKEEIDQYKDNDNVVTDWNNKTWLKVSEEYSYVPTEFDVGHYLKLTCLPRRGDRTGLIEEIVSYAQVINGPGKCPFEMRHVYTKDLTPSGSIRCVSYNILADLYADSDTARNELFSYCPPEYLRLDYRRPLFLKEILGYNGDIVCLQEVDTKVFRNDLTPVLASSGLEGVFTEKACQTGEGVACFYRKDKFRLAHEDSVMLSEAIQENPAYQDLWNKVSENEKFKEKFLSRTTALQVAVLETLDVPDKRIVVGNTHLFFHPESANVRLVQVTMCVRHLESLVKKYQSESSAVTTSCILCGDFNSCPQFGVYSLLTQGQISQELPDWKSNSEEVVEGMNLQHSLSFGSACGIPEYTNYTEGFFGCLDYIFYDTTNLLVSEIVPMPEHNLVKEHKALPSKVFPSDHLALVCTLKWK